MLGFLIAIAAGFLTPHLEDPVARPIVRALEGHMTLTPNETRLVAFMVALLGAAVLSVALDSGNALGISVGAVLGYFLLRLTNVVKGAVDGKPKD